MIDWLIKKLHMPLFLWGILISIFHFIDPSRASWELAWGPLVIYEIVGVFGAALIMVIWRWNK